MYDKVLLLPARLPFLACGDPEKPSYVLIEKRIYDINRAMPTIVLLISVDDATTPAWAAMR